MGRGQIKEGGLHPGGGDRLMKGGLHPGGGQANEGGTPSWGRGQAKEEGLQPRKDRLSNGRSTLGQTGQGRRPSSWLGREQGKEKAFRENDH